MSSIPQFTGGHRWHTLVALPGQQTLVRRDMFGLRPTPLGSTSKSGIPTRRIDVQQAAQDAEVMSQSSSRRPLVVGNLRRPVSSPISNDVTTLQTRFASAGAAAAARARVNKRH